jgi:hypothetical protein
MDYFVHFISFEYYANSVADKTSQPSIDQLSYELKSKVKSPKNKKTLDTLFNKIKENSDKMINEDK